MYLISQIREAKHTSMTIMFLFKNLQTFFLRFKLKGDPYDNSGEHESFFLGKIVTMGSNGNNFYDMAMESPLEGNFDIGKNIVRVSLSSRTQI